MKSEILEINFQGHQQSKTSLGKIKQDDQVLLVKLQSFTKVLCPELFLFLFSQGILHLKYLCFNEKGIEEVKGPKCFSMQFQLDINCHFEKGHTYLDFPHSVTNYARVSLSSDNLLFC